MVCRRSKYEQVIHGFEIQWDGSLKWPSGWLAVVVGQIIQGKGSRVIFSPKTNYPGGHFIQDTFCPDIVGKHILELFIRDCFGRKYKAELCDQLDREGMLLRRNFCG